MTLNDYSIRALRTYAEGIKYDQLYTGNAGPRLTANLAFLLKAAIALGERANLWKRALFYGKLPENKTMQMFALIDEYALPSALQKVAEPEVRDVVHAILGIVSESGELAEWLLKYLNNEITEDEFRLRVKEECGDALWYTNLGATKGGGHTLNETGTANILKLLQRYPAKFDPDLERDLIAEDAALKGEH